MSPPSVLFYIARGKHLRRAYTLRSRGDAAYLELFFRVLASADQSPESVCKTLEDGIKLDWEDMYDFVNPFGDRRGGAFESFWIFDLEKDVLLLIKEQSRSSVPLGLVRERLLTLDDFELISAPEEPASKDETLPEPHWEPKLDPIPREQAFLGQILRDFSYTWRHVIRREMNTITFMKLAYAVIWISKMEFTLHERMGFENVSGGGGGPYVLLWNLPRWETPDVTIVRAGSESSWFVLSQDLSEGLEIVRNHSKGQPKLTDSTPEGVTYTILTLRQVVVCRVSGDELVWTKPEKLFDGTIASDTAINMLIWTAHSSRPKIQKTTIHQLPVEIQDRILCHATSSLVAAAKLGCELGLGSPFYWTDRGVKIGISEVKRNRHEGSPVESQVILNGVNSALSYKRERW
ncbi:hypothetical protein F53441_4124 [Fusarium austroafricanum]|uniref:Uncharacterized protein n=1 Tax=Fusarium austroafricanum TaxID=2364996 RepID=A0A8H4KL00_9HYPO|nr:hypothetical protein F53441_4124 [Fusarium austroafricanum]